MYQLHPAGFSRLSPVRFRESLRAMVRSTWDYRALRASLAELRNHDPRALLGAHGRFVRALLRSREMRILWKRFEHREGRPYGVEDADRASILSFLDWLQDDRRTREGPRYDLPMTRGQTLAWLSAMTGISEAGALRAEWAEHNGEARIWTPESGWFTRPWHLAPPGAWTDPETRTSLCCDFYIN